MEKIRKEPYGVILILLILRILGGAFYGILTAISATGPFAENVDAILLLMLGELANIPTAIFFFLRKPYFSISYLIATALHMAGGILLSTGPFAALAARELSAQIGLFVPIVILDVLFLVYLALSPKVRAVFGANLFHKKNPA